MSLVVKVAARHAGAKTVITYLASDKNLHHDQRLVTGSVYYPGPLDDRLVAQVAADLNAYQQMTGVQSAKGHIYHVALSVSQENGALSDQKWADIANDYMTGMGFVDSTKAPVRWTAVNHGANQAGADHLHIVMSTIRQDGRQVSLHNDMKRASKLATELERKYGLGVLETRLAVNGAGSVPFTGREVQEAREQGKPEPDRVTLERRVRVAANGSETEAEFVAKLRRSGVQAIPFPAGDGAVTGYSVKLTAGAQAFGGGKLARDLTLPQLRRRWSPADATQAWRGNLALQFDDGELSVQQVLDGLTELGEQIQTATPEEFADLSHDLAAGLAATSQQPGDEAAKASREVGAWAQPRDLPTSSHRGSNAVLMLCRSLDKTGTVQKTVMVFEVAQAVMALHRLHRASRLVAGGQKGMAMTVSNPLVAGATAVARLTQEWADQRARDRQAAQAYRERAAANPKVERAQPQYWDAADIRASRLVDKAMRAAEKTRAELDAQAPRATAEQRAEMSALAARAGLNLDPEHFSRLRADEVDQMRRDFAAVPAGGLPEIVLPETSIQSPTGIKDVRTPEDADAFIRHLERKHGAKLDAEGVAEVSNVTHLPPAPASASASELTGRKDPRNWRTAPDPVTNNQARALRAAGLTAEQVGTLNKGEAGYIIARPDRQAAFEENLRTSPFQAQASKTVTPSAAASLDPAKAMRTAKPQIPKATPTQ